MLGRAALAPGGAPRGVLLGPRFRASHVCFRDAAEHRQM